MQGGLLPEQGPSGTATDSHHPAPGAGPHRQAGAGGGGGSGGGGGGCGRSAGRAGHHQDRLSAALGHHLGAGGGSAQRHRVRDDLHTRRH